MHTGRARNTHVRGVTIKTQTLVFGLLLTCTLAACDGAHSVSDEAISHADAATAVRKLPPQLRERFSSEAGLAQMDEALRDKELLIAEARRRRLNENDAVRDQVRALEDRLVVQELLKQEKPARATEEELRAFFDADKSRFAEPERVAVRRLFVSSRADAESAKRKASSLLVRLEKGESFEVLLKESDGPERVRGGDYGPVTKDSQDRGLSKAAFELQPGQHSSVVATDGGYSILLCDRRLPARTPPFEEVRSDVENRFQPMLERRAFDQLLTKLRASEAKP